MADDHFRERKRCLEILELSPSASEEEIKKAYKAQALKYHPDKNKSPNATEHFQEIQYAYKYLVEGPSVLDHHSDSDDEGIPLFFLMKLFPWLFQSMGPRYERGGGLRPEHFFQMFHDPHDPFGYDDSSDSDEDTYAYRGHPPQGGNRSAYTSSRFSSAGASAGTGASASADASSDRRRDSKRQKKRRAKEKHRAEKSAAAAASYTTTSSASSRERSTAASSDGQAESRKKDAPMPQTSLHEDRTTPNGNNHDSKKNNEAERSDFGKSTEDELNLSSNADQGQSSKSEEVKPDANTEPTIPHKKTKQRMREEQRKREEEMAKIAKELEEKVRMDKERKARKQAAQEAKERQEAELRRQQEEEEIEKEAKRLALEQKRKDEEAAQKKKEEDDEKERKRLLESFEPDLYMDSTGNFLTRDTTGVGNIKRKPASFNQHPFDPWEQEQENRPSYPPEQSFQYSRGGFRGGRGRGRGYFNQGSGFQPPGSFNMPNRFPAFVPESQSAYKPWADHPQQYVNRSDHFPAFRGQGHVARGGQRAVNPHDVYTAQVQQSGPSNVHANQENHVNGFERFNDSAVSKSTGQQDQPERNLSGLSGDGFNSQGGGTMGYKHHTHNSFHVSENNDRGFKGRVDDSNIGRKDTFTHSQPGLSCQGERGHVPGMPATFRPTTERSSSGNANNPPLPPKPLSSSGLHISINRPLMQSGANTHPMMQSGMNTRPMMQSGVASHPMMQSGANTHPMMQRAVSPSPPSPFSVAPPGFTPQAQNYPPPPHLFNPQQVFMPPSIRPPFISLVQPSEFTSRVKISPSSTFSPPPLFQQSTQSPLQQSTQLPLQQSTQPPLQQSAPPSLFQQHIPLSLQQSSQPPLFQQHTPPPLQQSTPPPLFQQHTLPPVQQSAPPPLFQQHTPPPLQQSTPPPLFQQHTSPPLQPSTSPPPQQSTPPPLQQSTPPPLQQSTPPPLLQQSRFSKPFNLPAHLKMNLNIPGLTLQRPTVPPFGGNTSGGSNKPETARTVSPDHGSVRAGGSRNYGLDDIDD